MEDKTYMNFIDENGENKTADVVATFEAGNPSKKYIIYTLNEEANDMVSMYAAIMTKTGNTVYLNNITDENEWKMIKNIMRDMVKENTEV